MENLTHSGHPNKRECNVGGVPNLSDYREIFGSFHSRAPSIPVLLLPQLDEADLFFDVGYSELFGDSDAADFAPSYEDLFGQPMAFEEARIPAEAEYLSEESDQFIEDPCFSIEHPDQSFQGSKEFSISSNRLNHTGQEQAAPVYSFVDDQTAPLPKIASKSASLSRADSEECRGGLMGVKQFGKVMSRPSHAKHGKVALDIHFVPQRGYDTNGSHCKDFVTISKISLQTEPSRLPPPSRPPPLLDVSKGGSSRSTSNCKSTDSAGTGCDSSPSFFDMEVDASSSAAAPATAMKETTRKSLEKTKSAKELMERKGEGFQSGHTKLDSKNSINNKGGNLRKSSAEERRGRASTSSHCCDKIDDTGKRKEATQFFELVKTDKPRKAVMQTNDELIWAQKVKLLKHGKKENEAGIEIYVQQEENAKKTIPVMREYELEEKKLKVAGEAFQTVENNERRKGAKDKHALKEQENKVKIAQEVSEQKARMNVRTAQLHQQTRNKLNVPAKPGKYDYFEDGQQKIEDEQAKQIKENRHTVKRASRRRENEKEAKESYKIEMKQREVLNQEYIDNWVKEAMQQGANVKRIKEAIERDEKKKLKEVCQREDNEKILIEAVQQIKNEKRPQGDPEQEWNETKLKDRELEGKERRLSMTREREENRLKETRDKEENAKRLKEAHEIGKNEKRLKKECERVQTEEGLKETRSRKENEKKLKNACEVEENEKKIKEANEQEGNQKIMKEACEREEHEKRKNEVHQREKNKKRWREAFEQVGSAKEQKEAQKRNDNDKKNSEVKKRVEEFWQRENYTTSLKNDLEQEESEARLEVFVQNEAEKAPKEVTRWKETESLYKGTGERKYLRGLNKVHEQTKKYEKLELPNSTDRGNAYKANRNVKGEPEGSDKNVKTVGMENMVVAERNKASGIFQANSEQKVENPRVENVVELHLLEDNLKKVGETGIGVGKTCINKSRKQAFNQAESKKFLSTVMGKEWVANGGKVEAVRPAVLEIRGNTQKTNNQVNGRQSTIIKDNNLNETCVLEERKTERTERERERERELEQQHLQKIEEMEREREREREKDRMAVDKATLESCESAHEKAERAAVERVNAGAPQKTLSETHERLEKACAETSEESLQNKASMETRLRMERTAVERPTTEAREHAVFEAKEGMERSVSDKFSCSSRVGRMRLSSSSSNLQDLNSQSSGSFDGSRNLNFSASGASYDAERYKFVEVESAQRCRARLERHRRTEERAAKALEEKNMRDLLALREQAERHRLSETLDAEVKRWSSGKHGNLRALLSTLQYILGPDSGWQPVPLTEVITNAAVKKAYRKATLCIHPDKLQQRGASIQHKYICEKVYDLLKEAWIKFNSGEL